MRSQTAAVILLLAASAGPVAGQVVVQGAPTPPTPSAGRGRGIPRPPQLPTREWEARVRSVSDSIEWTARDLEQARRNRENGDHIGALEQQLGQLHARLNRLQSELGPLQAQIAAEAQAAAAGATAEAGPFGAVQRKGKFGARRMVVVQEGEHPLSDSELSRMVKRVNGDPHGVKLPPMDSIARDGLTVAAGSTVGRVAAVGDLDVFGTVDGDAVALQGDVVLHKGGRIKGDALSVGGTVRLDGGIVDGELRSLDEAVIPSAAPAAATSRRGFLGMLDELQAAMGWLVAMVLLGFATMVFAEDRLRVVASTIETRFGRSLFFGVLSEVAFIPALALSVVVLIVTIIGIVLLPVAIPAIIVVGALLTVLGFLAVSRVAGQALTRRAAAVSVRGAELRSMLAGLFFFFGLWIAAALLGWVPVLGAFLHAVAFVVTWAAATVGLGAAVISRAGASSRAIVPASSSVPDIGWQTPTPISGIAAARRAVPTTPEL